MAQQPLKDAAHKANSVRTLLSIAHHEGYAAENAKEFGQLTLLLDLFNDTIVPYINMLADRFPSDLHDKGVST